jgi:hypothetical protein
VGDASSNYEDEAFESISMSKSMVGIGLGLSAGGKGGKKPVKPSTISSSAAPDDYSNDDFESMSMSKSITVSASTKLPGKKRIGNVLVVPDKKIGKFSNYSPIKEDAEEGKYQAGGSKSKDSKTSHSKTSPGDDYDSESETPSQSKTETPS